MYYSCLNNKEWIGYGRFLRSTDYSVLLDHSSFQFIGPPQLLKSDATIKQRVRIFHVDNDLSKEKDFSFYLSKIDDKWLIDVVLIES